MIKIAGCIKTISAETNSTTHDVIEALKWDVLSSSEAEDLNDHFEDQDNSQS
ncbi:hypothetical protein ACWPKS_15785 [Coraliomargarita sp. W4R72]